ncbi:hypothetical protein BH09BAC5_BH09BAC5_25280 [soil metagenome]
MEFREEITRAQQEKWFQSINNKFNNYFLIEFNGEKIGMIYGSKVDWDKKETGNGGIFIWEAKWLETSAPLAASLMLTEISFLLGLERTFIKVLRDNPRAISFNKNLGYELLPDQENKYNQQYVLTMENYFRKAGKFREPFVKQFGEVFSIQIEDLSNDSEMNIVNLYEEMNVENRKRFKMELP